MASTGFGAIPGNVAAPKKKTIKVKLPGDPGYVAPGAKGDGTAVAPKIKPPTTNKITSIDKPVAPPVTPVGSSQLTGPMPTTATNAPARNASMMSAASTQVADRAQQNQPGSMVTGPSLDPMSGFASRYDPSQVNAVYGNPGMILEDVLRDQGAPISNSRLAGMGTYANQMKDLAGLIALTTGGAEQDDTLINSIAELLQNGMGAGGGQVDVNHALQLLMNPQGNEELSGYLYGRPGDTQFGLNEQNAALQPMFQAAIAGVNPYTQQAMASAYRGANNLASQALGHGKQNPTITSYLRNNLRGIVPGDVL